MADYVANFVEMRAGQIDRSWQLSAGDKLSEQRRRQQASMKVHERTKSFRALISSFAKHTKRNDLAMFDVERKFQWEDVKLMAAEAIEQDNARTKMRHNPFRAAGRSFQRNASNLEVLVELLPNGEFTGILCGALTFVFCAARRLDEVRSKIISCLESLPEIVEETEEYVDIYDDDPKVWRAAEDLYIGILDGVESMLQWIDKSALGTGHRKSLNHTLSRKLTYEERAFKALLKPATFGKNVEEDTIKQKIEGNVAKFRNVVQVSLNKRVNRSLRAVIQQLASLVERTDSILKNQQVTQQPRTSYVTLDQLRASIGFNPYTVQRDMVTSMMDAQKVCPSEMISHALLVKNHNKFIYWLQSRNSQILFINGRMKLSPEQEAASPLTVLSYALAQLLAGQSQHNLPLVYLCGQHNRPNDPYSGASGVLRCLSSVMAESFTPLDVDLSATWINMGFMDSIRAQQLDALCMLFRHLVLAAKNKIVYVILDGVSWLEVSRHIQGLGLIITCLRDLVASLNQQQTPSNPDAVIVKVLITNPSTSNYARRWLPKECILEMDDVR